MINNINTSKNIPYGAIKDIVPAEMSQNIPSEIQNLAPETVIEENGFVNTLKQLELTPLTFASMFGIWGALIAGSQFLNNHYRGEWKESLLGKIGAFGDKLNNTISNKTGSYCKNFVKIVQDKKSANKEKIKLNNTISNKTGSYGKNFVKFVQDKTSAIKEKLPFITTTTKAECSLAKGMQYGVTSLTMNDTNTVLSSFLKDTDETKVKALFNNMSKDELRVLLDKISKDPKAHGAEIDDLIKMLRNNKDEVYKVKTLFELPGKNGGVKVPNLIPFLRRKVTFGEIANRMTAVTQGFTPKATAANKTALGKILPRLSATLHEGMTNGYAGGRILMVIQAFIFAQALQRAIDAPEGEKVSTFMESISHDLGYFVTLPLQVQSAHVFGSLKYSGMGSNVKDQKQAVKAYRDALSNINKNVDNMSHADYDLAVKELKEMLSKNITTGEKVKWYQKPFKAIGNLFALGLEKPLPYTKDLKGSTGGLAKILKKAGYQSKWVGGIGRLVFGLLVVAPFLAGIFARTSHVVFGKPTKSVLDPIDENAKETTQEQAASADSAQNPSEILKKYNMAEEDFMKKIQENPEIIVQIQQDPALYEKFTKDPYILLDMLAQAPSKNQNATVKNPNVKSPILQDMIANGSHNPFEKPQITNVMNQNGGKMSNVLNTNTIYTEENLQKEPLRTYVPSSAAAVNSNLTPEQQRVINDAMQKATWAEQSATRYL